jgi:hypothetical protein
MEGKPYTSSLKICPYAYCIKGLGRGDGVTPPHSPTLYMYFPGNPRIFKYKDDVTVILLIGISFPGKWKEPEATISFKMINITVFSILNRK